MPYFTDADADADDADADAEAQETKQLEEEEIVMKEGGLDECISLYFPPETPLKQQYEFFFCLFFKGINPQRQSKQGRRQQQQSFGSWKGERRVVRPLQSQERI